MVNMNGSVEAPAFSVPCNSCIHRPVCRWCEKLLKRALELNSIEQFQVEDKTFEMNCRTSFKCDKYHYDDGGSVRTINERKEEE